MRLALLIILLAFSGQAHAEPVTAAVAAFAALIGTTAATVYLVGAVVLSAGVAIYGTAQARRAERDARSRAIAEMTDRMANKIASESPHRHIYGRAKVGVDIVAMFTSGTRDEFKHLVCVVAAHECDAIEKIFVNNVDVGALASTGDVTEGRFASTPFREVAEETHTGPTFTLAHTPVAGSIAVFSGSGAAMASVGVTSVADRVVTVSTSATVIVSYEYRKAGKFGELIDAVLPSNVVTPTVRVQVHLGTPSDPVDPYLHSVVGDRWPTTAVLRGLTYIVVTLDLNNPEFQGGMPPIHVLARGKKLYDPRTEVTEWSANPALAVYDYLTGPLCGVPASDLPLAQFITAANVCDDDSVVEGGRYTINGTVTADQDQKGVLESMAQCMAGGIVSTTWDIYAGKYIAPVASLAQTDIVGSIAITPGVSDASIYNGVKGQFISPENNYILTDFKPYQNDVYREADGRDLYTDITFPFTDSLQRVTNLARIFTEDMRNGFTIKAEFSLKAWPRKIGERVTFTSSFFGQSSKVYRITDKSYAPNSAVQLTLKEDAESIWDFADAVELDETPNTDLPDPWAIAPPESITCTSGLATLLKQADGTTVPRILASWPAVASQAVFTGGQIEIEFRAITTATWSKAIVSGDLTEAYLSPVSPGWPYVVRARSVNPYLNTRSDWTTTIYQVSVFRAYPTIYKWAAAKPDAPTTDATYVWSTTLFGAAPTGWSLTKPSAPSGGGQTLWAASPLVTDISVSGSTPFNWSTSTVSGIDYAQTPDAAALAAAQDAQDSADAANEILAIISSDNYLSRGEKPAVMLEWSVIQAESGALYGQGSYFDVIAERNAYSNSYDQLEAYLSGLTGWNTIPGSDVVIVGSQFRDRFADYYSSRQVLLNAISAKAATLASWANISGQANAPADNATVGAPSGTYVAGQLAQNLVADAASAIANAAHAQEDANAANTALAAIASDNVLSAGEKPAVVQDWAVIQAEVSPLYGQGGSYGAITERDAFSAAYDALESYLGSLTGWNTLPGTDITIVGSTFRAKFADYYTAKQALVNAVAAKAATLASWANISGQANAPADNATVGAPTGTYVGSQLAESLVADAATAKANAATALTDAGTANTALGVIADDNVLSKGEKPEVILKVAAITGELSGIDTQADNLGVSRTAYDAAYSALNSYLPSGWNDVSVDTAITGTTFRSKFSDYYAAKQALLNAIAAKAATLATWAGIPAGSGKAADNATVGADNSNLATNAVGSTQIIAGAATAVVSSKTTSSVSITYASSTATTVASISYVAPITGNFLDVVTVSITGDMQANYVSVNSGAGPYYDAGSSIWIIQSVTGASSAVRPLPITKPAPGVPARGAFTFSEVFTATPGTSYTFTLYAVTDTNTMTVDVATGLTMRIEGIHK